MSYLRFTQNMIRDCLIIRVLDKTYQRFARGIKEESQRNVDRVVMLNISREIVEVT